MLFIKNKIQSDVLHNIWFQVYFFVSIKMYLLTDMWKACFCSYKDIKPTIVLDTYDIFVKIIHFAFLFQIMKWCMDKSFLLFYTIKNIMYHYLRNNFDNPCHFDCVAVSWQSRFCNVINKNRVTVFKERKHGRAPF